MNRRREKTAYHAPMVGRTPTSAAGAQAGFPGVRNGGFRGTRADLGGPPHGRAVCTKWA
jgi:hypothetical protein